MKTIGYYPGCSLHGGGRELDMSLRAVSRHAGVELREIGDWNCCGATAAHNLSHELAVALPYRNLALAEEQGLTELLAPCAACFSRLKGTNVRLARSGEVAARMQEIVGRPYKGTVRILNLNEYVGRLLADGFGQKLTSPLGLKVAAYYGCLLSRGQDIIEGENAESPTGMEAALQAAGCEVVPWNFATECCGGGFSMSLTKAVLDLSGAILADARAAGAEAIVTACPMCHSNLDMRQLKISGPDGPYNMPVLYLTEVLGLAAGLPPKALGLDRHFVDAMPVAAGRASHVAEGNR
jgi:heterodisulfide reductase subunit B